MFGDHQKHGDPQSPHVNLFRVGLPQKYFRCDICWRATSVHNFISARHNFREAKIGNFHSFHLQVTITNHQHLIDLVILTILFTLGGNVSVKRATYFLNRRRHILLVQQSAATCTL